MMRGRFQVRRALLAGVAYTALATAPALANIGSSGFNPAQPYLATGGFAPASPADRSTFVGRTVDLVTDLGGVCNGNSANATADTAAWHKAFTLYAATAMPVAITAHGTCEINDTTQQTVSGGLLSFFGFNGGGIQLVSGLNLSGDLIHYNQATTSGSNFWVDHFKIDLNNATNTTVFGSGGGRAAIYVGFNWSPIITDNQIINMGSVVSGSVTYLIEGYQLISDRIERNYLTFTAASREINQCINLGENSNPSIGHKVLANHCVNTGIEVGGTSGKDLISQNKVEGWGYGGAITYEGSGGAAGLVADGAITDNWIANSSATGTDVSATYPDGIEIGYIHVKVSGNHIHGSCGPGIATFYDTDIGDNTIWNVGGNCPSGGDYVHSGIVVNTSPYFVTNQTGGGNGAGAYVHGNSVYDDGGGLTSYGYSDTTSTGAAVVGVNNFQGKKGSTNVVGGTSFSNPQPDERFINPCFAIDQRGAGATVSSSWATDQWQIVQTAGDVTFHQTANTVGQCAYGLTATVTTSITPGVNDFRSFYQNIVNADILDFRFGFPYASSLIFSFATKANFAPPYTGSWYCRNLIASASYVGTYTITAAANNIQWFSFIIPGDQAHGLGVSLTTSSLACGIDIGAGTNNLTSTLLAWQAGQKFGATTATPFVSEPATSSIEFSDMRLASAGADTGWVPPTYADQLKNAQRFYYTSFPIGTKPAQNVLSGAAPTAASNVACMQNPIAGGEPSLLIQHLPMYAGASAPTITLFNPSAANASWRDVTTSSDVAVSAPSASVNSLSAMVGATAAVTNAGDLICGHFTIENGQ